MEILTLVMSDPIEEIEITELFYFHHNLRVGELFEVEVPGRFLFYGEVIKAYSAGRQIGDNITTACRVVVAKTASLLLF